MTESHEKDPVQGEIVHEYDGILEADNQLPRWWLGIFFGSIAFGVGYWFAYESWDFADTPAEEYALARIEAAQAPGAEATDESLELLAADDATVATGRTAFETNCVACHGAQGEGRIGPNLTDANWIHGGGPADIYHTIRDGFTANGMPAWGAVLGEQQVQAISAYVLTLRDTNVPGRPPQGEPWVPGGSAASLANEPSEAIARHTEPAP
jgi:cytochrome c oxidase cbb3-type subunit 3